MPHDHKDLQKAHDKVMAAYKANGTRHVLHRQGYDLTLRVMGMTAYPVGATINHVTETDPTDTTYTDMSSAPIFGASPGPEDINQAYLSDCWDESPHESVASFPNGLAVLKSLCQPSKDATGKRIPGMATVFVSDGTIWTAVDMKMTVGAVQSQIGPSGAIWNDLLQKAAALAISGITVNNATFASLNFNSTWKAFALMGCKNIRSVSGIAQAQAAYTLHGGAALETSNVAPADVVTRHAYGYIWTSWRNPWGKNSGGMTEYRQFTDAEIQGYGMTITVTDPLVVDPLLPIPLSETSPPAPVPAPPAALPAAPFQPSVFEIYNTALKLTWGNNALGSAYASINILRSTDNVTFSIVSVQPGQQTQYFDQNLTPGTMYYYKVEAVNGAGVADSVIFSATTKGGVIVPPPPPTTPQPITGIVNAFPIQFINGAAVK